MSNWSSFKNDQLIMESWRSYNNEEIEVLNEATVADSLKRLGSTAKSILADLERKGEVERYAEEALKALQDDPAFKIDQAGTEAEKAAIIMDRQIKLLQELIARKRAELELGTAGDMEKKAIEDTIAKATAKIKQIETGGDKPAAAPAEQPKQKNIGVFNYMGPVTGRASTGAPQTADLTRLSRFRGPDAAKGGDDAEGDAGDGEGDGEGTGDQKLPIPVFKKFTGKERETIGMPRASAGSLSSQLMKLYPDIDKAIITQILKDIAGQLKTNNIQIQEAKKLFLEKLISEVRRDKDKDAKKVAAFVKEKNIKPGDIERVKKLRGVTGKSSFVAVNKKGVGRVYSKDKQGKEEAQEWSKSGEATPEEKLYDLFVRTLKRLDLHTQAGRKAAKENEQSYLGAFRFFKAMQLANRSLKQGDLKVDYEKILRKVEPLNEEARYGARVGEESGKGAGKDLKTWLGNMINIFKEDGLADNKRGMAAIKAAKKQKFGKPDSGPRTKADIEREREAAKAAGSETSRRTGKSGVVNTRAVVGPRLKQGGVDLDSPEGRKLQKNIEKVIRGFLKQNLKRVGANPNLIAEQKFEDRLVGLLVNYFSKV
tara:strand:- start:50 stop:1840 length:1791 start_codon:yes stop_codon:yes gene_type:complete